MVPPFFGIMGGRFPRNGGPGERARDGNGEVWREIFRKIPENFRKRGNISANLAEIGKKFAHNADFFAVRR